MLKVHYAGRHMKAFYSERRFAESCNGECCGTYPRVEHAKVDQAEKAC
jgi:hypothetical protein